MTLSDQALSCIMISLQKGLMEQIDIVPMLKDLHFQTEEGQLFVSNPPQQLFVKEES